MTKPDVTKPDVTRPDVTKPDAYSTLRDEIVQRTSKIVGSTDLECIFVNGWRMDFSTTTAVLFRRGEAQPAAIAKIGRGSGRELMRDERANLELLARSNDERFLSSVPRVLDFVDDGRLCLMLESTVDGRSLRPPLPGAALEQLARQVPDWLVAFHRATGLLEPPLSDEVYAQLYEQPFDRYQQCFDASEAVADLFGRARAQLAELRGRSLAAARQHGDLAPPNVFVDSSDQLGVIDWEEPLLLKPCGYDLLHLFACLGVEQSGFDGLRTFETVFFRDNDLSRAANAAASRYCSSLALDPIILRPLFTLYWVDYALEKLDRIGWVEEPEEPGYLGVWGLARFAGRSCLNLELLAREQDRLVF